MQQMRHTADLLNRSVDGGTGLAGNLPIRRGRAISKNRLRHHLGRGKFLPQAVMQFPRDPAPFVILHGDQAGRKPAQRGGPFVDDSFQFDCAVTDRVFEQLAVMNVRTGPIPFDDSRFVIANRNRTGPEPAVIPIPPVQPIFRFIIVAGLHTGQPFRHGPVLVLGMHVLEPAEAIRRSRCGPGKFIKSIADVVPGTVLLAAEDNVRGGLHNGVKFLVLSRELVIYLLQGRGPDFEFQGPFRNPFFQFAIQPFELVRLAVQLRKYADLRPQQLGNDRDGDIVDGAPLVSSEPVHVRQVDGRDEDDRGPLEAGMLANQVCQLKTVQFRHAYVHQHDRDIGFQQMLQRVFARAGLDQILSQLAEHRLIGEQLARLVIHHENIDLFVCVHGCSLPPGATVREASIGTDSELSVKPHAKC